MRCMACGSVMLSRNSAFTCSVRICRASFASSAANAAAYTEQIQALDDWARKEIAGVPAGKRRVLASHDSLEYVANAYGITLLAVNGIAGRALGAFARETWPDEQVLGVLIGALADPGPAISDRVQGITEGVHESLPTLKLASLDTGPSAGRE